MTTITTLNQALPLLGDDPSRLRSRKQRRRLLSLCNLAAALLGEFERVAPVAAHVGESAFAAMILALAAPEGRALRGEEAVVGSGFDVGLSSDHVARVWCGEGGGRESCDDEGELHGGVERFWGD